MITIGLIGEDPNDTVAIMNLLNQKYRAVARFVAVAKKFKGGQLESAKFFKNIDAEMTAVKCHVVICIRDLDGFRTEEKKVSDRITWFEKVQSICNLTAIFLLNVWEIEALIFADINVFNKMFNAKLKWPGDPSMISEPKEQLIRATRKLKRTYVESDCKQLFSLIDISAVYKKCASFRNFIDEFQKSEPRLAHIKWN